MSQTSYALNLTASFAGMLADGSTAHQVETRINAEASAEIPFGTFVVTGGSVGDAGAVLPSAGTTKLVLGPVVHSHAYSKGDNGELGTSGLKPKTVMNVLVRGRIWVLTETSVAVGDPVFVRYASGAGGTVLGRVRNATVSSEMIDLTTKARFITSATVTSTPVLACIEVDMTA